MASVSTYLNFPGNTEAAFEFYRSVFGTQYEGMGLQRMGSVPAAPGQPPMPEAAKNLVLHVALPILGGHEYNTTAVANRPMTDFRTGVLLILQD